MRQKCRNEIRDLRRKALVFGVGRCKPDCNNVGGNLLWYDQALVGD